MMLERSTKTLWPEGRTMIYPRPNRHQNHAALNNTCSRTSTTKPSFSKPQDRERPDGHRHPGLLSSRRFRWVPGCSKWRVSGVLGVWQAREFEAHVCGPANLRRVSGFMFLLRRASTGGFRVITIRILLAICM